MFHRMIGFRIRFIRRNRQMYQQRCFIHPDLVQRQMIGPVDQFDFWPEHSFQDSHLNKTLLSRLQMEGWCASLN